MCGYVLARCFTNSWMVGLAAGSIAIVNPLVIQDINKLGIESNIVVVGTAVSSIIATSSKDWNSIGWYTRWVVLFTNYRHSTGFMDLFAGMFGVIWLVWFLWTTRPPFSIARRWISSAAVTAILGVFFLSSSIFLCQFR